MLPSINSKQTQEMVSARNPYKWLLDQKKYREKHQQEHAALVETNALKERVHKVATKFCDWSKEVDGKKGTLKENDVISLFSVTNSNKPSADIPMNAIIAENMPPELKRIAAARRDRVKSISGEWSPPTYFDEMDKPHKISISKVVNSMEESVKKLKDWRTSMYTQQDVVRKREAEKKCNKTGPQQIWSYGKPRKPPRQRYKYGSWYMPLSLWKKRNWEEELVDPLDLNKHPSTVEQLSEDLNKKLSKKYISNAFHDFMNERAARVPEFLQEIARIQEETREDEERKLRAGQEEEIKRLALFHRKRLSLIQAQSKTFFKH